MTKLAGRTEQCMGVSPELRSGQEGVALLTVLLMLMFMTLLGIASITITGMENRMSGFLRTGEAASEAAESCIGVGANLIQQTWMPQNADAIPPGFLSNAVPPGPVPLSNAATLRFEIKGKDLSGNDMTNNADSPATAPNLVLNVNGLAVNGDIDRMYVQNTVGTGSPGGSPTVTILYRINCVASNVATGSASPATAVYGCVRVGGSGQCSKIIY